MASANCLPSERRGTPGFLNSGESLAGPGFICNDLEGLGVFGVLGLFLLPRVLGDLLVVGEFRAAAAYDRETLCNIVDTV